jgi:hypothetical protein
VHHPMRVMQVSKRFACQVKRGTPHHPARRSRGHPPGAFGRVHPRTMSGIVIDPDDLAVQLWAVIGVVARGLSVTAVWVYKTVTYVRFVFGFAVGNSVIRNGVIIVRIVSLVKRKGCKHRGPRGCAAGDAPRHS